MEETRTTARSPQRAQAGNEPLQNALGAVRVHLQMPDVAHAPLQQIRYLASRHKVVSRRMGATREATAASWNSTNTRT